MANQWRSPSARPRTAAQWLLLEQVPVILAAGIVAGCIMLLLHFGTVERSGPAADRAMHPPTSSCISSMTLDYTDPGCDYASRAGLVVGR